jgi:mono/diheme cytochrome c family protein
MPLDVRSPTGPDHPEPSSRLSGLAAPAALVLASGLLGLGLALRIDPPTPEVHFGLSEETLRVDDSGEPVVPPEVRDHIRGSLEMLFGTPSNPHYLRSAEWIDEGYDPNYPQYPVEDPGGSGEIDEGALEALQESNALHFHRQLAAIEARRWALVDVPANPADLASEWRELLAATPDEERGEEFQAKARELFVEWYPTLRSSAEFYRQQCLHCHGPEGGGNGPTADFLNPRPRDYRRGVFKDTALKDKAVPRRRDLYRILEQGITGTAMPSFRRFPRAQLEGAVDYVRLLAIRGMVERDLVITFEQDGALPVEYVAESYQGVWERWRALGEEKLVAFDGDVPPPTPESIARGDELYHDATKGNCASCHGDQGRGDGVAAFTTLETGERVSSYKDDWGYPIYPRDLTRGQYRFGRRPIDVYRRIYAGINGTPMPALGESKDAEGNPLLSQADLWALVHYVGSLSESRKPQE